MNTYPRRQSRNRHYSALRLTALLTIGTFLSVLAGCVSQRQPEPAIPVHPPSVPGTELDPGNRQKVRFDENMKAYPVGRYVDPADSTLMHEAHVVYRKENSAAWNLAPHAPTVVPLGPVLAVSDPAKEPPQQPLTQTEHKAVSQQQLVAALIEQNEALTLQLSALARQISDLRRSAASSTPTTTINE